MKEQKKVNPLATESEGKLIAKFAIPAIISMLVSSLYNIVDQIFIGQGVGLLGNAATNIAFPVSIICTATALLLGIGSASNFNLCSGAGDHEKASRIAGTGLSMLVICGVIIAAVVLVFLDPLLHLFGVTTKILPYAQDYTGITAFGIPFLILTTGGNHLIRADRSPTYSMTCMLTGAIINTVLDPLFIFGFHWSVAGAAGASLISRMIACFILMWRLRDPKLDIRIGTTKGVNMRMIKQILHIGIPNGIENSIFQLGRVLTVSIIAMFGTTQIAANAIANNLDSMGVLPGTAMCLAIITVVGRCVGAGDFEQAEYYAKKMMKLTYIINGICCLVVILTMPVTLRLYGVSGETRHLGAVLALIHNGCAIFLWPAGFCLPNVMRAANDVKFPMCVSIASMFIFRIGLSYVTGVAWGLGAIGVWIAMIIDWIVRITFFAIRFFSGKWKTFYHGE